VPQGPGDPKGPRREGIDERQARQVALIGAIVLAVALLLVFIVENSDSVEVSFVFFTADISLIWVIVLSALVGAAAGFLVSRAVRKRFGKRD
jgi:uncharacterized integral membrane protein